MGNHERSQSAFLLGWHCGAYISHFDRWIRLSDGMHGDRTWRRACRFRADIQPLLTQHCTQCHGGVRGAGGLLLLPAGGMPAAGDSGKPPVVPGKPEESELFRRVTTADADERMPAGSPPLPPEAIAKLRQWIEDGGRVAAALVACAAEKL